jgi:orotidine-5'-phosphate decarboxylase
MSFFNGLGERIATANSLLCIGLDPDGTRLPAGINVLQFNKAVIAATHPFACAYKLNFAFYEAMGPEGWGTIRETLWHIPKGIPVIADAKRADIGNTSRAYARAIFDELGFDAVTVNPYLGGDALEPFLDYTDKGVYILCRTSNPGAADLQNQAVYTERGPLKLYQIVADKAEQWNTRGNAGLVVGATAADDLRAVRNRHPELPFLVPGVGAQGGDLEHAVLYGRNLNPAGLIINASRQVIFASSGPDFAEAAGKAAEELRDEINRYR